MRKISEDKKVAAFSVGRRVSEANPARNVLCRVKRLSIVSREVRNVTPPTSRIMRTGRYEGRLATINLSSVNYSASELLPTPLNVKGLPSYHPTLLPSKKKVAFTLAEVFLLHFADCRKVAFTLAEVLITLGIIGVVAALTLPTLIARYQEKQTVTKLKKVYSTLSQAFRMAEMEHGPTSDWFVPVDVRRVDETKIIFDKIKPHLSIIKDCGAEPGCWTPGKSKFLNGVETTEYDTHNSEYRFVLKDGASLLIYAAIEGVYTPTYFGHIKVDIDGKASGKYTYGKDIFEFQITDKGIVPFGLDETFNTTCYGKGTFCSGWVIHNENMDYLHCEDLSWDGKHSCK